MDCFYVQGISNTRPAAWPVLPAGISGIVPPCCLNIYCRFWRSRNLPQRCKLPAFAGRQLATMGLCRHGPSQTYVLPVPGDSRAPQADKQHSDKDCRSLQRAKGTSYLTLGAACPVSACMVPTCGFMSQFSALFTACLARMCSTWCTRAPYSHRNSSDAGMLPRRDKLVMEKPPTLDPGASALADVLVKQLSKVQAPANGAN